MTLRSGSILTAAALSVALAACGSSSSPSQNTTAANGSGGARRAAIAACLKKQGITVPSRPPGNGPGSPPGAGRGVPYGGVPGGGVPGGGLFGGGAAGNGANDSRFRTALQKCGVSFTGRPRGSLASSAAGRAALNRFTACVRKNGYKLPAPNLSGKGPVFDASKVNRSDPKFMAAVAKCQALISRPTGPGAAPPPGVGGGA